MKQEIIDIQLIGVVAFMAFMCSLWQAAFFHQVC